METKLRVVGRDEAQRGNTSATMGLSRSLALRAALGFGQPFQGIP